MAFYKKNSDTNSQWQVQASETKIFCTFLLTEIIKFNASFNDDAKKCSREIGLH